MHALLVQPANELNLPHFPSIIFVVRVVVPDFDGEDDDDEEEEDDDDCLACWNVRPLLLLCVLLL